LPLLNKSIEILKPALQTFLGALITLLCSVIFYKYQFHVETKKEYLKYENKYKKERVNNLKTYFKIFTKYFRMMVALNAVFSLYLKGKIRYEDWLAHTGELKEIDMDEIALMQLLYLDTENSRNFHKIFSHLSTIMLNSEQIETEKIKDEYLELLKNFALFGTIYQKEIIELIKKENP
jgi:hypothetical protein